VDPSGLWEWDDNWIQKGVGGLLGFYGSGVAADGWSANMNVAIHKDIHAQAAAAREKAWRGYREATNPVDAGANLLFGVGLNAVGEGCAHGGFGIAEVVTFGGLRGGRTAGQCAAPKLLANIGELAAEHQATLKGIWRGEQPLKALPESVRQQLAGLYSRVASENPAGFAQAAFNEARAKFLLGQGPNPGPSVNEFARRMGIPVFKRN
jgi:hypothetical protein